MWAGRRDLLPKPAVGVLNPHKLESSSPQLPTPTAAAGRDMTGCCHRLPRLSGRLITTMHKALFHQ